MFLVFLTGTCDGLCSTAVQLVYLLGEDFPISPYTVLSRGMSNMLLKRQSR